MLCAFRLETEPQSRRVALSKLAEDRLRSISLEPAAGSKDGDPRSVRRIQSKLQTTIKAPSFQIGVQKHRPAVLSFRRSHKLATAFIRQTFNAAYGPGAPTPASSIAQPMAP
jgi:hypothetical protein